VFINKAKNRLSVDSKQWAEFIPLPGLPGFFSESLATRNEKRKKFSMKQQKKILMNFPGQLLFHVREAINAFTGFVSTLHFAIYEALFYD
jgi:hypothetical protein